MILPASVNSIEISTKVQEPLLGGGYISLQTTVYASAELEGTPLRDSHYFKEIAQHDPVPRYVSISMLTK